MRLPVVPWVLHYIMHVEMYNTETNYILWCSYCLLQSMILDLTWDFDEKSVLKNIQSDVTTGSRMDVTLYNAS